MEALRHNIVIDCGQAWAEDFLGEPGDCRDYLRSRKALRRCIMTTQDQTTGERVGGNPIQGLSVKRMSADQARARRAFRLERRAPGEGIVRLWRYRSRSSAVARSAGR